MPTTIKLKNSVTTTNAPSSLVQGEVAINITDKKVWVGNAATTPIQLLGDGASASFGALSCTTLSASGVATFSAGTVSAPAITTTGDTNTGIFFPAADTIAFTEGGAESMRITSSGDVGIGSTTPGIFGKLAVKTSSTSETAGLAVISSANDSFLTIYNSGSVHNIGATYSSTGSYQPIAFVTSGSERMRIGSDGNVGVGITNPNSFGKLAVKTSSTSVVAGLAVIASANDSFLTIYDGSSTFNIGATYSSTGSYRPIAFLTSDVERMRITSTGKVGIGITPAAWDTSANSTVLQVYSSSILDFLGAQVDFGLNTYYDGSNYRRIGTAEATRYSQSGGAHFWSTAASGSAGSTITWTEQMRINANSPVLCLAGGSTAAGGTGIAFPAIQNASSNANTLDDYEEGTFTPTISGTTSAGTASYVAQIGTYTKVGRLVFFEIYVNWSSGTGTGFLKIDNLPFTSGNTSGYPAVSIGWFNQVALSANSVATAFVGNNESQIYFYEYATGGGASGQVAYDAAGGIQIAGCYQVG
jgi:hypothetical protein